MDSISINDRGAAVEDVQHRLARAGYFSRDDIDGVFGQQTADALKAFCADSNIDFDGKIDETVWAKLVDESYELGDRVLFLRLPFFHGRDVRILQSALSALGFATGGNDGLFGPHTEEALRKFQLNLGLPADGIAGAFTFKALLNLKHSWEGNNAFSPVPHFGFARAAEVLETNMLCLFGTTPFTRSVAARMSNLSRATNPNSKVTSAESLLVEPEMQTIFVQIMVGDEQPHAQVPIVDYEPLNSLSIRLEQAFEVSKKQTPSRIALHLPSESWEGAGESRSAQHYAIVLLDALCAALATFDADQG